MYVQQFINVLDTIRLNLIIKKMKNEKHWYFILVQNLYFKLIGNAVLDHAQRGLFIQIGFLW